MERFSQMRFFIVLLMLLSTSAYSKTWYNVIAQNNNGGANSVTIGDIRCSGIVYGTPSTFNPLSDYDKGDCVATSYTYVLGDDDGPVYDYTYFCNDALAESSFSKKCDGTSVGGDPEPDPDPEPEPVVIYVYNTASNTSPPSGALSYLTDNIQCSGTNEAPSGGFTGHLNGGCLGTHFTESIDLSGNKIFTYYCDMDISLNTYGKTCNGYVSQEPPEVYGTRYVYHSLESQMDGGGDGLFSDIQCDGVSYTDTSAVNLSGYAPGTCVATSSAVFHVSNAQEVVTEIHYYCDDSAAISLNQVTCDGQPYSSDHGSSGSTEGRVSYFYNSLDAKGSGGAGGSQYYTTNMKCSGSEHEKDKTATYLEDHSTGQCVSTSRKVNEYEDFTGVFFYCNEESSITRFGLNCNGTVASLDCPDTVTFESLTDYPKVYEDRFLYHGCGYSVLSKTLRTDKTYDNPCYDYVFALIANDYYEFDDPVMTRYQCEADVFSCPPGQYPNSTNDACITPTDPDLGGVDFSSITDRQDIQIGQNLEIARLIAQSGNQNADNLDRLGDRIVDALGNSSSADPDNTDRQSNLPAHRTVEFTNYDDVINSFYSRVSSAPVLQSFNNVSGVLSGNGSCPAPEFDLSDTILGRSFTFDGHCSIAESIRSPLYSVFLVVYSIIGFRVLASA